MFGVMHRLTSLLLILVSFSAIAANNPPNALFGYRESPRSNLGLFPQWLSVLERHIEEMTPEGQCDSKEFNRCHMREWQSFLRSISHLDADAQIRMVNGYANNKEYVLDIENYGINDYWASPKQFLLNNGDCEDYAIIKMMSLKQLGFDQSKMRVVVVQDTNQRVAHAVMSIDRSNDILILDNQIQEVISHRDIFHYVPVYSVNESSWWMHLPNDHD
jgi:predicted transglutaminase-like cysteine proteinase